MSEEDMKAERRAKDEILAARQAKSIARREAENAKPKYQPKPKPNRQHGELGLDPNADIVKHLNGMAACAVASTIRDNQKAYTEAMKR